MGSIGFDEPKGLEQNRIEKFDAKVTVKVRKIDRYRMLIGYGAQTPVIYTIEIEKLDG